MHSLKFHQNFYFWQLKQSQQGNQDISTNKKTKNKKQKTNKSDYSDLVNKSKQGCSA